MTSLKRAIPSNSEPKLSTVSALADPVAASPIVGWMGRGGVRLVRLWHLKCFGTMAFMAVFFWAYFSILAYPVQVAIVMPEIWLDHWIDFSPNAFAVYVSLWGYVFLPPALMGNRPALMRFGLWVGGMCLFCLALFWIFPTQTPVFNMDWSLYPGIAMVKGMDAAGNACPSLHVASAVFSAFWLHRILMQLFAPALLRWFSALHCLAIIWSTMATLQHVALDVFGGVGVGLVFAYLSLRDVQNTA